MGLYAGLNNWIENVYQFEETDLVIGGPDGIDNKPLKDLADRTQWLKSQIGLITRLDGDVVITANAAIGSNLSGNLITAYANASIITLTLDDVALFQYGSILCFSSFAVPGGAVCIKPGGGRTIFDTDGAVNVMYMHHKEQLFLVACTDHWKVVNARGNFYSAGEEIKARKELVNTVALKGQILQRAQYPRLWNFVNNNLTIGHELITEAQFFSDAVSYRGFFTTGDGANTFRLPDERGMSERMLDLGRGIDLYRNSTYAGGYEKDGLALHQHSYKDRYYAESADQFAGVNDYVTLQPNGKMIGSHSTDTGNDTAAYENDNTDFQYNGNPQLETTVKNIGKLTLIKY